MRERSSQKTALDAKAAGRPALATTAFKPISVTNNSVEMRTAAARKVGYNSGAHVLRSGRLHLNAARLDWNDL